MIRTHFSHYTNEELLSVVFSSTVEPDELAFELATRLEQLMDEHDAWGDEAPMPVEGNA